MHRLWPEGRTWQLIMLAGVMVPAILMHAGLTRKPAATSTPPASRQSVTVDTGVPAPDTRAGQLPPLNRELVVMTDSDMQHVRESRQELINRPDPF